MFCRVFSHDIKRNTLIESRMNTAKKAICDDGLKQYTGKGIGIAFLDTGISPVDDFVFPRDRIVAFRDFIGGSAFPYDDNGHGTHVTGFFRVNSSE